MLLANSKQSVTMSEYQSCVIPSLSLCLKTNIQLINEHEECPLEQFEKKKFKLYRKVSLLWQMECNKISCQFKTNPSALDYLTDAFLWWWMFFLEVLDTVKKVIVIYVNWQLPLIT